MILTCCHIDSGLRKSKSNLSFPSDEYSVTWRISLINFMHQHADDRSMWTYTVYRVGAEGFGKDAEPSENAMAIRSEVDSSTRFLGELRSLKELHATREKPAPFFCLASRGYSLSLRAPVRGDPKRQLALQYLIGGPKSVCARGVFVVDLGCNVITCSHNQHLQRAVRFGSFGHGEMHRILRGTVR